MSNLHEIKLGLREVQTRKPSDFKRHKPHNHYPLGKTGYVPGTISNPVRL